MSHTFLNKFKTSSNLGVIRDYNNSIIIRAKYNQFGSKAT